MAHSRPEHQRARRAALWILYLVDVGGADPREALLQSRRTIEELEPELDEKWEMVVERVMGVHDNFDEIDAEVQNVSPRWKIERMAPVDRNILRLGAWELLHGKFESPIAVIDHCVELGKEYGEKNTPGFVNGLLDQICQDHSISMR